MNLDLDIFRIQTNNVSPVKGRILIAEPFLKGYYFSRSIVLLTEHGKEGSMGLVLNKPLNLKISQIMKDVPFKDVTVYCGGPVSPDRLFYVHAIPGISDAAEVISGLYFGGNFDEIKTRLTIYPDNLDKIRFFIGYSGWSAGQLKDELNEDSWLVSKMENQSVLKPAGEELWTYSLCMLGGKYIAWSKFPSNPELN